MKRLLRVLAMLLLTPTSLLAQYSANTTLARVPYPLTIPCPASSCPGGGSLTGANTIITPTDFNIPIVRVTDINSQTDKVSYTLPAEGNDFDTSSTRLAINTATGGVVFFSFNPATQQATGPLYGANYHQNGYTNWVFSRTTPYLVYDVDYAVSGNPGIYSWDLTSTSVAPTKTLVVDLTTCVPGFAGAGFPAFGPSPLFVSADDQTFLTGSNTASGNAYIIIWNRTNGCRVFNPRTQAITGTWGPTGQSTDSSDYDIHGDQLSLDGNYVVIGAGSCYTTCTSPPSDNVYYWHVPTLTVTPALYGDIGHYGMGYTHSVNAAEYSAAYGYYSWFERDLSTPNQGPPATLLNPSQKILTRGDGADAHPTWNNDNALDTAPFCTTTTTHTAFIPSQTYENEIFCMSPVVDTTWRFGHTYSTMLSGYAPSNTTGSVSQDGKWYAWTSDWDGMLGKSDGSSNSCVLGTNCRSDVFIIKLTQSLPVPPPAVAPATALFAKVK